MSQKSKRQAAWLIWLFAAVTVIAILGSIVAPKRPGDQQFSYNATSYLTTPTGLKALYDGLMQSGYKVERWRKPAHKLVDPATLIIARPTVIFTGEELAALRDWVAEGNTVILAVTYEEAELVSSPLVVAKQDGISVGPDMPESFRPGFPSPLFRGVNTIETRYGCRIVDRTWQPFGRGASDSEIAASSLSDPPLIPLVQDSEGGVIMISYHGAGKIYILSCPWLLSNQGISLRDNNRLVANLIGNSGSDRILFDEFHQGYSDLGADTLFSIYSWLGFIQAVVGALLYLLYRSIRFGDVLTPPVAVKERTEYTYAMADLLRRSHGQALAAESVANWFLHRLSSLLGVSKMSSETFILDRLRRYGLEEDKVREALGKARSPKSIPPDGLLATVRTWHDILSTVEQERFRNKQLAGREVR